MSTSARGRRSALPGALELAALMTAENLDAETVGARYGVTAFTVRDRLSHAGFRFDGTPAHKPKPKPVPVVIRKSRAWMDQAVCAQVDAEIFFPDKGGGTGKAKRICNGVGNQPPCPVRAECLEDALANGERFGVRGGLSERERRVLERRRVA